MKGENTIFRMHLFKSIWCIFYCINWITVATHDESIINKNCLQLYDHNKKHFLDWIRFNFISTNKKHFTQPRIFFFFDQSKFCQRHEMRWHNLWHAYMIRFFQVNWSDVLNELVPPVWLFFLSFQCHCPFFLLVCPFYILHSPLSLIPSWDMATVL